MEGVLGFLGGIGPLVLGLVLFAIAVLVVYWLVQETRAHGDDVEWHWVIGIGLLFLMGIIPGLIGLWLYFKTRNRGRGGRPSPVYQ